MKKLYFLFAFGLLIFSGPLAFSQTTVLNPAGAGGFELGATFALNGWTVANDAQNKWYCGTFAKCNGSNAAYIDVNATSGAANTYNMAFARVSHFYRDVTFPAGQSCITLTFNYKGQGEGCCDYVKVFMVGTGTTPVGATQLPAGNQIGGTYNLSAACTNASITIPAAYAGTTQRLVFSWINDASLGTNPALCVDDISIVSSAGPANDDPCGAIVIPVNATCTYVNYTNACASGSVGPTAPGCANYLGGDVWFKVTVPASGAVVFDTQTGVVTDGGMAVYSGAACGALTLISCDDDNSTNGLMPLLSVSCQTPGTTLWVRFWEYGNDNNGTFGICAWDPGGTPTAPVNDNPCSATALAVTGSCSYVNYTNQCATASAGPPAPGCSVYSGGDVWFTATVPASGSIMIDTQTGVMLDGGMAVYSGSCGALTLVACDDDNSPNGAMPYLSLSGLAPGTTIWIRIWESGNDNNGSFGICVTDPCPGGSPANDLPCNATVLSLGISITGNNSCSGNASEPAAPACWTNSAGQINTVWYRVVCPASGQLSIRTGLGTLTNTQISVYQGACGALVAVAGTSCDDDFTTCGNTQPWSEVVLTGLTAGNTYFIAVDGYSGLTGDFSITAIDGTSSWPVLYGPDCQGSIPVCSSTMTVGNPGFIGSGNYCDYPGNGTGCPAGSCIFVGERNSVWYNFTTNAAGTISFTLTPNIPVDYDWALYDVTGMGTPCASIAANTILPIRCSYSGATTPTGMGAPGTEPCDGTGGTLDAWSSTLATVSGNSYLLLVSNFSTSTFTGFNLNWNASPINYTGPTTFTWTGAVSTDWNTSANWGGCGIPDCTRDVVIFAGPTNQPIIPTGVTVSCKSITIQPSAAVTMNGTATLNVCGDFINNGNFTAVNTSTVNFMGTGVQNVNGSNSGVNKFGNFTVTKATGSVVLNQTTDIGGNFTSANGTSILNSNSQYVRLAGNFNNFNGNTTYTNTGTTGTLEFNGTAPQAYNQGASQLDLNFVLMNHTGAGLTLTTNMFIKSVTGSLTLTLGKIITNANRVDVANTTPACVTVGNTNSYVFGNLWRSVLATAGAYDFPVGTAALYERAYINLLGVNTYTRLQARFDPWPVGPNTQGGTECGVTYSLPSENMGYWTIAQTGGNTGTYNTTLYCTGATNTAGANAWTVEKATVVAGPWILNGTCLASTAAIVNRNAMSGFSVFAAAQAPTPLPVELGSFTGHPEGSINILDWTTLTEINNDYFMVEKSNDAINYEEMERVTGAGNSNTIRNYNAVDEDPFMTTYYRLKQVDFNGDYRYYGPVAISNNDIDELSVHNIYPNPADHSFFIEMYSKNDIAADLVIYDSYGRVVFTKGLVISGLHTFEIQSRDWTAGVYIVKVINEEQQFLYIHKMIIE